MASQLSCPPSSVHAAVIAINEAIDQGVPEGTLAAMQNPNAMLVHLDAGSARQYHDTLYLAKGEKVANSRKRVRSFHHKEATECGGGGAECRMMAWGGVIWERPLKAPRLDWKTIENGARGRITFWHADSAQTVTAVADRLTSLPAARDTHGGGCDGESNFYLSLPVG